jgi:type I restriction enzyme R subunit
MSVTDTSEKGLEALIVRDLVASGYVQGHAADYNRDLALDVVQLLAFLRATQPKVVETLNLDAEGIQRTQFLHRLQGEIAKRGVVDVLRKGVSHRAVHVDLYKLLPTPGNAAAAEAFGKNIFSVTRQVSPPMQN